MLQEFIETPTSVKPTLRQRYIAALRANGHRQCCGAFTEPEDKVCAVSLLAEITGIKDAIYIPEEILQAVGVAASELMYKNDICRWPFAEIADWLEINS